MRLTSTLFAPALVALAALTATPTNALAYGEPGQLAFSPDGRFAYVSGSGSDTTVALSRDQSTGALTRIAAYDGGGGEAIALSPDGRFLYAAGSPYYSPKAIQVFARDASTGALTHAGAWTQAGAGTHYLAISPDGNELYASEDNQVVILDRDPSTGTLSHRSDVQQGPGGQSVGGAIALSPDGHDLYAASGSENPFGAGIATLARDADGNLTAVAYRDSGNCQCRPTALALAPDGGRLFAAYNDGSPPDGEGRTGAGGLLPTPGGDGLYVADWYNHRLYQRAVPSPGPAAGSSPEALARDPQTGELEPAMGSMPIVKTYHEGQDGVQGVRQPNALAMSPDNQFVYLTGGPGTVAVFRRDPADDRLSFASITSVFAGGGASPYGAAVTINDGAEYTNDRHVVLTIKRIPVAWAEVSNDGGFAPSRVLQPPQPSDGLTERYPWTLATTGPDKLPKSVYVRLVDSTPPHEVFIYPVASDDIVLDESPPQVVRARREKTSQRVAVRARDRISGVSDIQLARHVKHPGSWRAYRARKSYGAGSGRLYVRARDRAGNRSRWRRVRG